MTWWRLSAIPTRELPLIRLALGEPNTKACNALNSREWRKKVSIWVNGKNIRLPKQSTGIWNDLKLHHQKGDLRRGEGDPFCVFSNTNLGNPFCGNKSAHELMQNFSFYPCRSSVILVLIKKHINEGRNNEHREWKAFICTALGSEKLECREKLLFHKWMGWMRLKAQTTAQNLVIYLKWMFLSLLRLLSQLCYGNCYAILPWTTKVQPHCRSENVREAVHARIKDVLKSCVHLR